MRRLLLILCALLAMAYSAGTQAQNVWNGTVADSFAGGSGTAEDPYLIADGAQLKRFAAIVNGTDGMAQNKAANGKLTADILLNDTTGWKNWNESTTGLNSWTPIGNSSANRFTGTLEGAGHSVSGIYINSEADIQGLVGYLGSGGTLQNLGVKASYIKGGSYIGGLCGRNSGTVANCYNTGSVTGVSQVGGMCGMNNGGTVTNCYNSGNVTGSGYVGGLCGVNEMGDVANCYNTGSVTGTDWVGGVCGWNSGTVTNCYNTGSVTGNSRVGGLCGQNEMMGTVTNCYYLDTCGAAGDGTSKTAGQFQSGEVAWLLQGEQTGQIWGQNLTFDPKDSYPVLGGLKVVQSGDGYKNELSQDGDFYQISTADELRLFASMVNGGQPSINGKLTADILLNDTTNWTSWDENTEGLNTWTPIGSSANPFTGTLDGAGHSVSGIYINSGADYQGLVGYLGEGGTLQDLGVKASYIKGGTMVGGICGCNMMSTVSNCYNTGKVIGTGRYVGGVCGNNEMMSNVANCYNTGSIKGTDYVGGVCGWMMNGTVTNCYNTGSVTGTDWVGGLYGWNDGGTVTNCYNTGNVAGSSQVGGVCGTNEREGNMSNCYNTGKVIGDSFVGGVCGWNEMGSTVSNCYNTGSVEGSDIVGGLCGVNMGDVTNCYYLTGTANSGIGDGCGDATEKNIEQFKSGEVAWLLNGSISEGETLTWYQNLGEGGDTRPVLDNSHGTVYATYRCDGNAVVGYNNTATAYTDHSYDADGFCITCGQYQPATLNSGVYEISNAGQLFWFAALVNGDASHAEFDSQNAAAKGRLTADILLNDIEGWENWESTAPANTWTPIGSYEQQFTGTLDGDGHSVNGIYINSKVYEQGLVGCLGSGGTLQNLGVKASYIKGAGAVGGLCGANEYGTVTNCYNTGSVTGSDRRVGGVCGINNNGNLTNCYNTGSVEGSGIVGGVCGENMLGTVTNCYNTGSVTGSDRRVGGVCGDNWGTVTNCYYLEGCGATVDGTSKTAEQFKSGEVAWLLQNGQGEQVWGQTIGTDNSPVWQTEGNKVYKLTLQNGEEEPNALYANSGKFKLPAPVRTGYTFAGWFTAQADGTQVQDNAELTADLMLYAQWTANSYTVTFEANGGVGSMNQQTFTYDVKQALNQNAFTRTGYSFTSWNTKADGKGSTYKDREEVLNLTAEANGNITLYAQWSINIYTIRFVDEDGTELQSSKVEYGQTPVYEGVEPTKESTAEFDFTFAGWNPEIVPVTGDATYTATYTEERRSYTLTVELAEGCEGMGEVSGSGVYEYGSEVTVIATALDGYKFTEWSDGNTDAERTITIDGDITLKALFDEDTSGLTGLSTSVMKVIGGKGTLEIIGTDAIVFVYDVHGSLVYEGPARTLYLSSGVYVVRSGISILKAMVK